MLGQVAPRPALQQASRRVRRFPEGAPRATCACRRPPRTAESGETQHCACVRRVNIKLYGRQCRTMIRLCLSLSLSYKRCVVALALGNTKQRCYVAVC